MRKLTTMDIKLNGEGIQLKDAFLLRFVNLFNIYEIFESHNYSQSTISTLFRKKKHDTGSKFIKLCELLLSNDYRNIVITVEAQLRRFLTMIRENYQYYDSPNDIETLEMIKEKAIKYGFKELELETELRINNACFALGETQTILDIISISKEAFNEGYYDLSIIALCDAAKAELSLGDFDKALAVLESGIHSRKFASNQMKAVFDMTIGEVKFKCEDWDAAINYFESAFKNYGELPNRTHASIYIARCYVRKGSIERGISLHKQNLKDSPSDEVAVMIHLYLSRSIKNRREAANHIEMSLDILMNSNVLPDTIVEVLNDYYKQHSKIPLYVHDFTLSKMSYMAHAREKSKLLPELAERILDSSTVENFQEITQAFATLIDDLDLSSAGDKSTAALISKLFSKAIKEKKYWFGNA